MTTLVMSAWAASLGVEQERRRVYSMGISPEQMPINGLTFPQDCLLFVYGEQVLLAYLKRSFKHTPPLPIPTLGGAKGHLRTQSLLCQPWVPLPLVESC